MTKLGKLQILGPGLLFAGAAVGTSHLVQSTRAGAVFGLGLLGVVIIANLIKYPAFRFGAHYAAATGRDLVAGYRTLGWFPPLLFALVLIVADGFAMAGISVVTAGIIKAVFGLGIEFLTLVACVMAAAGAFLIVGRYRWLERLNKLFMLILAVSTLVATVIVLPRVDWSFYPATAPNLGWENFLFVAALAGWMPTPIESSVFSSLWTVAKKRNSDTEISLSAVISDFNVGYWGTAILAVCFVLLGAGILHAGGIEPVDSPAGFARQVMDLYAHTLGEWAVPFVGIAAVSVMFTTCLAAFDGLTRSLVAVGDNLRAPEAKPLPRQAYAWALTGLLVAAYLLAVFFLGSFKAFIDFVTSLAFFTAPVLAWFNHRVMASSNLPDEAKPAPYLMTWSLLGITVMTAFAVFYLLLIVR